MPLNEKHLDALKVAGIDFSTYSTYATSKIIRISQQDLDETLEILHNTFPEIRPVIPLKLYNTKDGDFYVLFIVRP